MDFLISYDWALQIQLLISFGLLVLIWLVQLIIYPSFQYVSTAKFIKWHQFYTPRITVIVAPLMIVQLIAGIYLIFLDFNFFSLSSNLLIVLNWLITFIYFVPLHVKLDQDSNNQSSLKKLVSVNRYRTFLWSCVFIIVLTEYLS